MEVPVDRAILHCCHDREHGRINAEPVAAGPGNNSDPFGPGRSWNPGGALPEALERPARKSKARSHRVRAT